MRFRLTELDRRSYLLGLKIAGDFGVNIAAPVVLFVIAGRWLQEKFLFAPYGVISGFILASVLSAFIIKRKAKRYASEYKSLFQKK